MNGLQKDTPRAYHFRSPLMADPPLRLGEEPLERLSALDDEGVVALLDALVDGCEHWALRDHNENVFPQEGCIHAKSCQAVCLAHKLSLQSRYTNTKCGGTSSGVFDT